MERNCTRPRQWSRTLPNEGLYVRVREYRNNAHPMWETSGTMTDMAEAAIWVCQWCIDTPKVDVVIEIVRDTTVVIRFRRE